MHPGASAPSRRYPADRYAAVAQELIKQGYQVALTGTADEVELTEQIRAAAGPSAASLAGKLKLPETAALLSLAPLLIANNTGVVHIAAAAGTPVVDLYALTNPQHTPWAVPSRILFHDVPCKNCFKSICPERHHNCLRLVDPQGW
jgi:ADP-heptose:LPS heptosyltransferase